MLSYSWIFHLVKSPSLLEDCDIPSSDSTSNSLIISWCQFTQSHLLCHEPYTDQTSLSIFIGCPWTHWEKYFSNNNQPKLKLGSGQRSKGKNN